LVGIVKEIGLYSIFEELINGIYAGTSLAGWDPPLNHGGGNIACIGSKQPAALHQELATISPPIKPIFWDLASRIGKNNLSYHS
jgi:hypothetical protein